VGCPTGSAIAFGRLLDVLGLFSKAAASGAIGRLVSRRLTEDPAQARGRIANLVRAAGIACQGTGAEGNDG
jgi:hypothetical protein